MMPQSLTRRSVMVMTPACGEVYIAARTDTPILECFWRNDLNTIQRTVTGNWLSSEGWFQYANGIIDLEEGLFDRIQDGTGT